VQHQRYVGGVAERFKPGIEVACVIGSHLVAACGYQCPRRNVALIMKATETRWVGGAWERHRRAAAAIEKAAAEFNVPATKLMAMRR
jgi:hypothetical protein